LENQYEKKWGRGFGAYQECTYKGRQSAVAIKFYTLQPNTLGPQHRNCWIPPFWRLDFLGWLLSFSCLICALLVYCIRYGAVTSYL